MVYVLVVLVLDYKVLLVCVFIVSSASLAIPYRYSSGTKYLNLGSVDFTDIRCVEFTDVFIYDCNLCLSLVRSPFYTIPQIQDSSMCPIGHVQILRIPTLVICGFSKP